MNHTKEPWIADDFFVQTTDGEIIASCDSENGNFVVDTGNAKRIAACVNACRGISTEGLERYHESHNPKNGYGVHREAALEAHRDHLLGVINKIGEAALDNRHDMGLADIVLRMVEEALKQE